MTTPTHHCVICGSAVVGAPAEVCRLHLVTSEEQLLAEQAGKPSAWILAAEAVAVRPLPSAAAKAELAAGDVVLASFWQRFFASVIDLPIATFIALFFAALASASPPAATLLGLGTWFGYFLLSNSLGQLVGKAALSIKVIDPLTGREPGFAKGALRTVGQGMTVFLTFGLGFLMMTTDARKMAVHDHLAGTLVVRTMPDRP